MEELTWLSAAKEVEAAATLLNKEVYGRLALRLKAESELRRYVPGQEYSGQDLLRDAFVKSMEADIAEVQTKKSVTYPTYIRLANRWTFKLSRVNWTRSHFYYSLT